MYSQIASNKRRSIAFILLFFVLWLGIGALAGLLFGLYTNRPQAHGAQSASVLGSVYGGMFVGACLAIIGIIYSLTAGAALVLRVSGAEPADPVQYQQIHDLVELGPLRPSWTPPPVLPSSTPRPRERASWCASPPTRSWRASPATR